MDSELERLFDSRVGASANLAGTLNIEESENEDVKTALMTMQRVLLDAFNELENQVNQLKK